MQELPWVLLGLCTAFKEDIGSSFAVLVYGTTLSLPGELIVPNTSPDPPHSSFLHQFRNIANSFWLTLTSAHGKHGTYMPTDLQQARFVFVRRDAHKPPLQPPYDGPFPVVSRHTKHFHLDIGGRQDKVSIDRLKPALLDHKTEIAVATRPKRGRPPKEGYSERSISERVKRSKNAVHNAVVKFQKSGTYSDAKRSGRPQKTTPRDDHGIRRTAVRSPMSSASKIRSVLLAKGTDISRRTVSRRLVDDFSLKARKPA